MEAKAFISDPFDQQLVEVEICRYWRDRVYVRKAGGGLLREKWFGTMSFVNTVQVPMSAVLVVAVPFS